MVKKITVLLLVICLMMGTLSACGKKGIQAIKIDEVEIELIDPAVLKDNDLKKWYEDSYREKFIHTVSFIDGYKYVLLCAGEMPTGGYSIEIMKALEGNGTVLFYARLVSPPAGEEVTQSLTYPHILFRIKENNEITVRAELNMDANGIGKEGTPDQFDGVQGYYIGLADNNFVEIDVDKTLDFPGNNRPIVFKLSDEVMSSFVNDSKEYQGFKEHDVVRFDCVWTEDGQWKITEIVNLSAGKQQEKLVGEYVGQADANSVEIKIEGELGTFRLAEHIKAFVETNEIERGAFIEMIFIDEAGMMKIIDMKVIPAPGVPLDAEHLKVEGTYIERIDERRIILKVGQEEKAYWLAQEIIESFVERGVKPGDKVKANYYQDNYKRLVITLFE